jgi:UDP-2-acetamido-2-deoxy-ribo-hexuluronate aminotransferase
MTGAGVPLVDVRADAAPVLAEIKRRMGAVLEHGQFILGPEVRELEAALASFVGGGSAISVSSGRDALLMALMAEGIRPGDAVFVPAFTFVATAGAVIAAGAAPVFVDVDPRRFTLDVGALENAVVHVAAAGRLRPRAVIPVDLFGMPADYPAIDRVAAAHGLFVIADAAQGFGGRLDGIPAGRLAPVTATSFFPTKPLGGFGDGGCLFTADEARTVRLRAIRVHGLGGPGGDECMRLGLTGRLDTLQAAVLLAKLGRFGEDLAARRRIAEAYSNMLEDAVTVPWVPAGAESAWAHYSILTERRDAVRRALAENHIASRVYYARPLHLHEAFADYGSGPGSLPVTERLSREVLSLPLHPQLPLATAEEIAAIVRTAV